MEFLRRALVAGFLLAAVVGCGRRGSGDGGGREMEMERGDGGPARSADPRCPEVPAFTGMACRADQLGAVCPGSVMCACSGTDFRTVPSECTCGESAAFGRIFECAEACEAACAPDAGRAMADAGPALPPASCAEMCVHLREITCPMELTDCEAGCESLRTMGCPAEFDAYVRCAIGSPLTCVEGYATPTGCNAEDAAWSACFR